MKTHKWNDIKGPPPLTPEQRAVVEACGCLGYQVQLLEAFLHAHRRSLEAGVLVERWIAFETMLLTLAAHRRTVEKQKGVRRGVRRSKGAKARRHK